MATAAVIRQRVYDNLYGVYPTDTPFVTRLAASYATTATSIVILDEEDWAVGDTLENFETGEQYKVLAVSTDASDTLTVEYGWNGTTNAASVGSDDVVFKSPRFTQKKVDDAVTAVCVGLELWGVHAISTGEITRADPVTMFDLTETDFVEAYGVLKLYRAWEDSETIEVLPFRFSFNLATGEAEWTQSNQLFVGDFGSSSDGDKLYFTYAQQIADTTDLLPRQEEMVVAGATASVLGGAIVPATQDPGARTDRTVQPGQVGRDVRHFQGMYFTLARTEAALVAVSRQKLMRETPRMARARRWVG